MQIGSQISHNNLVGITSSLCECLDGTLVPRHTEFRYMSVLYVGVGVICSFHAHGIFVLVSLHVGRFFVSFVYVCCKIQMLKAVLFISVRNGWMVAQWQSGKDAFFHRCGLMGQNMNDICGANRAAEMKNKAEQTNSHVSIGIADK